MSSKGRILETSPSACRTLILLIDPLQQLRKHVDKLEQLYQVSARRELVTRGSGFRIWLCAHDFPLVRVLLPVRRARSSSSASFATRPECFRNAATSARSTLSGGTRLPNRYERIAR